MRWIFVGGATWDSRLLSRDFSRSLRLPAVYDGAVLVAPGKIDTDAAFKQTMIRAVETKMLRNDSASSDGIE